MNLGGLVTALLPVFFVLALGYAAGKCEAFDAHEASGLSKLAISFALPAQLFVAMSEIPRALLLQQGPLVLALILAHAGVFVVAWAAMNLVSSLRGTPATLYALMLSTSATPDFGLAVLKPILGPTAPGAVALVALSINVVVPIAVVLLDVDAARSRNTAHDASPSSPVLTGLRSGLKSPLLWATAAGIAVVLARVPVPRVISACFSLVGSTTSGVAVFAVGLVLSAQAFQFSRAVFLGTLGRLTIQNAVLLILLRWLRVESPFSREALICCSFPLATIVVLFAARYKSCEAQTASMLLLSILSMTVTVPIILWLTHHWPV
jgi:malonate transporter and related proteins